MYFHGVQKLNISNTTWNKSAPLELFLTNGGPITKIKDIVLKDSGKIRANNNDFEALNVTYH
jgi:poly(beta-D-mannuronate) lyase